MFHRGLALVLAVAPLWLPLAPASGDACHTDCACVVCAGGAACCCAAPADAARMSACDAAPEGYTGPVLLPPAQLPAAVAWRLPDPLEAPAAPPGRAPRPAFAEPPDAVPRAILST